jgi:hypothetical protein
MPLFNSNCNEYNLSRDCVIAAAELRQYTLTSNCLVKAAVKRDTRSYSWNNSVKLI